MGVITITGPAANKNVLLYEDLPSEVQGTSGANTVTLLRLISRASAAIARELGRELAQQTYREDVEGHGDTLLEVMKTTLPSGLLPGGPITTVTSVQRLDTENGANPETLTDTFLTDAMAGHLYRRPGWDNTAQIGGALGDYVLPNSARPLYRVTYTAGWTMPTLSGPSTLPEDIRQAGILAVTGWFFTQQRDPTITRRRMGDVEIDYGSRLQSHQIGGLPQEALDLIWPWKRVLM